MRDKRDLAGSRCGLDTVLTACDGPGARWYCRCDCGALRARTRRQLVYLPRRTHHGCQQRERANAVPQQDTELTPPVDTDQYNCTLTRTGALPLGDLDLVGYIVPPAPPWVFSVGEASFDTLSEAEAEAALTHEPVYCRLRPAQRIAS